VNRQEMESKYPGYSNRDYDYWIECEKRRIPPPPKPPPWLDPGVEMGGGKWDAISLACFLILIAVGATIASLGLYFACK